VWEQVALAKALPVAAVLLVAGDIIGLIAQFNRNLPGFIVTALVQGALWTFAAGVAMRRKGRRPVLFLILATAILLRAISLTAPVFLSDDINRYVWDGRVQAAGINPYRYVPSDPALASLRDEAIFWHINRGNYAPTIYPPVAQMLFLIANFCGGTVLAMKLVLVAVEAVGIWALLIALRAAGAPQERILLYAWHPLPVWEIAGSGHIDAAVVAFVGLALAAALTGRRGWSGAALAAATLVKFSPLALAPALWRPFKSAFGDWRWPAAFVTVAVAAYLPYIGVGWRVLGFLPDYVAEEKLVSGSGFWLFDMARRAAPLPPVAYLLPAVAVMAGLALAALRRPPDPRASLPWATALATAAMFLLSPHYPWYFVWLVGLLAVAPWWPAWWPTLTAPLLYWEAKTGDIPLWPGATIYGGFVTLCCVDMVWRFFAAKSGAQHGIHRAI
jgi:alpha-1,6-mannosyltransferase